jgi:2-polyprenyl-3-methyl-5-hydroxy-6-metoxy-1,4-benzoquinol methylase
VGSPSSALLSRPREILEDQIALRCDWAQLEAGHASTLQAELAQRTYTSEQHRQQDLAFHLGRFAEGRELVGFLHQRYPRADLRILDLGAGNGAVAMAMANRVGYSLVALDYAFTLAGRQFRRDAGIPVAQLQADGMHLPFAKEAFDVVLCLETLEHVPQPAQLGAEIMRVLRPGGICVLTTPARLSFLLRRDPHFAVPGLLLFSDRLQKWIVTRVLKRLPSSQYDVAHIYSYAGAIIRMFPGRRSIQAVGAAPRGDFARWMWSLKQRLFWERLIIQKLSGNPTAAHEGG